MRCISHKNDKYKMEVKNFAWNENLSKRCNHPLQPQGITGLITDKSGCGISTLVKNFLLRPGWLDYNNIKFVVNATQRSNY